MEELKARKIAFGIFWPLRSDKFAEGFFFLGIFPKLYICFLCKIFFNHSISCRLANKLHLMIDSSIFLAETSSSKLLKVLKVLTVLKVLKILKVLKVLFNHSIQYLVDWPISCTSWLILVFFGQKLPPPNAGEGLYFVRGAGIFHPWGNEHCPRVICK